MVNVKDRGIKLEQEDFLERILLARGVEDIGKFLEPNKDDIIHYSNLKNIDKAVELFSEIESKGSAEIVVVVDADFDGYSSSAILGSYLEEHFPHLNLVYLFHENREHGLTNYIMKRIKETNDIKPIDLLILPDSGTSDYKHQCKIVEDYQVPIIILDHHEATHGESQFAITVNNQLSPKYENKQLSGVGIVYKFLQALDDKYCNMGADEYLDLVSIGNIADSMNLTSLETRYYVYEGLKKENIKNKFLIAMIEKHIGDFNRVYPQTLAFGLTPKINALIRIGKDEEKVDLFKALKGVEENSVNSRTGKTETIPQKMVRVTTNAHKRQKTLREKWIKNIEEKIESEDLNNNAFLVVKIEEKFDRELGGVIASMLAQSYRKPTLILVWSEERKVYTGSLRGYDPLMTDTKDFLEELEIFEMIAGHQQASGFKIQREQAFKLNEAINVKIDGLDMQNGDSDEIVVDFFLSEHEINVDAVEKVYEYEHLWGKGAEKPMFATEITLDTTKMKKSNSSNMIEWYHNDVKFVQFSGDVRLIDMMKDGRVVELTLVGSLSINHFLGRATPQFLIEAIEIGELKEGFVEIETVESKSRDILDDLFDW